MKNKKIYNLYIMYNNNNEILYIGKTTNINRRMFCHFSEKIIESEPWKREVNKIKIINIQNRYDMDILEIYLIGMNKPKHNKDFMHVDYSPTRIGAYDSIIDKSDSYYYSNNKLSLNKDFEINLTDENINVKSYDFYNNLSTEERLHIKNNIHLYGEKQKDRSIRYKEYMYKYSTNWYMNANESDFEQIIKELSRIAKGRFGLRIHTGEKLIYIDYIYKNKIKGNGYVKDIIDYNCYNEYSEDIKCICYMHNDTMSSSDYKDKNIELLSIINLLNKIYQYRNKNIDLYVPSVRMRELLTKYLNGEI